MYQWIYFDDRKLLNLGSEVWTETLGSKTPQIIIFFILKKDNSRRIYLILHMVSFYAYERLHETLCDIGRVIVQWQVLGPQNSMYMYMDVKGRCVGWFRWLIDILHMVKTYFLKGGLLNSTFGRWFVEQILRYFGLWVIFPYR